MPLKKIKHSIEEPLFFTSDTHFGHRAVVDFCGRPFKDSEEMDEVMIENWNRKVPKEGIVYHLGDFAFRISSGRAISIRERLNGKIHLISGNHDRRMLRNSNYLSCFDSVEDYSIICLAGKEKQQQFIALFHFAMEVWEKKHYGAWHFYGHSHRELASDPARRIHVGVDTNEFSPVSYRELAEVVRKRLTVQRELANLGS